MAEKPITALSANELASDGLRRSFDEVAAATVRRIRHPSQDRDEDLHAVRTAIKRLRAWLRMIRPVISEAVFRKDDNHLKKAARSLAFARDAAVGTHLLGQLSAVPSGDLRRSAFVVVHDRFGGRAAGSNVRRDAALRAVANALEISRERFAKMRLRAESWGLFGAGLEAVYRACRKRMRRAFSTGEDEAFHRWRIRVKSLSYALQYLAPSLSKRHGRRLELLGELQSKLGADHDLIVLKESLRTRPGAFGGNEVVRIVLRELSARSRLLRKESRPIASKIFEEKPRRFVRRLERYWTRWRNAAAIEASSANRE